MSVFYLVITVVQLLPVVWCQPILMAEPAGTPNIQVKETCNVTPRNENEKRRDAQVNMAYPPEGTGLFRDPLEVLGPLFPAKKSINTCEMHLKLIADTASDARFTRRGEKVCADVCSQYRTNMITDGPVDVTLREGYCDYSNHAETLDQIDLTTTCTCVYRVKCNSKSSVIVYSFQTNAVGFVKVTVLEPTQSRPVT